MLIDRQFCVFVMGWLLVVTGCTQATKNAADEASSGGRVDDRQTEAGAEGSPADGGISRVVSTCEERSPPSDTRPLSSCLLLLPIAPLLPELSNLLASADLNGDGYVDVVTHDGEQALTVAFGTGHGTFTTSGEKYFLGFQPAALSVGDLDGDDLPDLLASGPGLAVLFNLGAGTFSAAVSYSVEGVAQVAHLNADDFPDFAVPQHVDSAPPPHTEPYVWLNDGSGTFAPQNPDDDARMLTSFWLDYSFIAAGDINRDGKVDLLTSYGAETAYFAAGAGIFLPGPTIRTTLANDVVLMHQTTWPALVGIDAEGFPDLVSNRSGTLLLRSNLASGTFDFSEDGEPLAAGQEDGPIIARDLNCDSLPELVSLVNRGGGDQAEVLLNRGGSFTPHGGYRASSFTADDVNEDGSPDLLLSLDRLSRVLLNRGDGTFPVPDSYPLDEGSTLALQRFDGNDDGLADLALIRRGEQGANLTLMLNRGAGEFEVEATYPIPSGNSQRLVVADLDGKSGIDVAIVGADTSLTDVYLSRGGTTFAVPVSYPSGEADIPSIVAGDVDTDGAIDIVVAGTAVNVLLNHGDGTFAEPSSYDAGRTLDVTLGDLDDDGALDIVLAGRPLDPERQLERTINILLNRGDGSFEEVVSYPRAAEARSVALVDVDADDDLDIMSAGVGLGVHRNLGDGTFSDYEQLDETGGGREIMIGDLDDDGTPDIITASGDTFVVRLNDSMGRFGVPMGYWTIGEKMAIADFDGDGRQDLVAGGPDGIELYRNGGCLA